MKHLSLPLMGDFDPPDPPEPPEPPDPWGPDPEDQKELDHYNEDDEEPAPIDFGEGK